MALVEYVGGPCDGEVAEVSCPGLTIEVVQAPNWAYQLATRDEPPASILPLPLGLYRYDRRAGDHLLYTWERA